MPQANPGNPAALVHPLCFACGKGHPFGLRLQFTRQNDGSVRTSFECSRLFEGYPDHLHGGIIATILDSAMTHCLFSRDNIAVTAELSIRYRHPVRTEHAAEIQAWIERESGGLFVVRANLRQEKQICATACGKFLSQPNLKFRKETS